MVDRGSFDAVAATASAAYLAGDSDAAAQIAGYEKDIKIAWAGPLAPLRLAKGRSREKVIGMHADSDGATIYNAAIGIVLLRAGETLPGPDESRNVTVTAAMKAEAVEIRDRLERETDVLLQGRFGAVKRIAEALLERGRLEENEIDRLIAGRSHG
jgi:hypothetical protein